LNLTFGQNLQRGPAGLPVRAWPARQSVSQARTT
jgi:hypothetical protein